MGGRGAALEPSPAADGVARNPIFIYVLFTAAHELLSPLRIPVAEALLDRRRIYVKV